MPTTRKRKENEKHREKFATSARCILLYIMLPDDPKHPMLINAQIDFLMTR